MFRTIIQKKSYITIREQVQRQIKTQELMGVYVVKQTQKKVTNVQKQNQENRTYFTDTYGFPLEDFTQTQEDSLAVYPQERVEITDSNGFPI